MENNTVKHDEPKAFNVRLDTEAMHELEMIQDARGEATRNKTLHIILKEFRQRERQVQALYNDLCRAENRIADLERAINQYSTSEQTTVKAKENMLEVWRSQKYNKEQKETL